MKQICITLVLVFLLSNCLQTKYDYKTENIILDCFYEHHKDNDINIKTTIDKIEAVLLKHSILEDKSGKSYIQIIKKIKDNSTLNFGNPELLEDIKSIGYIPSSVSCSDSSYASLLDSASVAQSKLKYLIGIFDSIQVKGHISPTLIAEEILDMFNAEDFENDYYRTVGLVMFSSLIKMNDYEYGLARKLPLVPERKDRSIAEVQNTFKILINSDNKILVDGKPIERTVLKSLVKEFITSNSEQEELEFPFVGKQKVSKGTIYIQSDNLTDHKSYLLLQYELSNAYSEIRDSLSKSLFNKEYKALGSNNQQIIKNIVPQKINEAKPIVISEK